MFYVYFNLSDLKSFIAMPMIVITQSNLYKDPFTRVDIYNNCVSYFFLFALAKPQPPPVIENGKIEAVIYKCNSGFFLNGSSMLLFSEDGTFEQDPPKCLGKL